jgi:hypothetical protein
MNIKTIIKKIIGVIVLIFGFLPLYNGIIGLLYTPEYTFGSIILVIGGIIFILGGLQLMGIQLIKKRKKV